jgi:hypothetical protein
MRDYAAPIMLPSITCDYAGYAPPPPHYAEIYASLGRIAQSVVVFSSHCFHGGTLNTTEITRMAVHSAFVRRSVTNCEGHSYEQQNPLSPAVLDRLCETAHGRAVVTVLDVTNPSLCVDTVVDKKSSKL